MDSTAPEISVVIPIFNEEANIRPLMTRLFETMTGYGRSFEIIAVDDGSRDTSVTLLEEFRREDSRLRVIRLSRNFGQSPALYAGFSQVRGKYAVMLDADLQNFPEDIPMLLDKLEEGYDMVSGWREQRQDSLPRMLFSRAMNWYIARITGVKLHDYGCALRAFRRELVDHMAQLSHRCRYLPVDVAHLGGRFAEVRIRHAERKEGNSKYGPLKLVRTAMDVITSMTAEPLQYISLIGFLFATGGFAMGLYVLVLRIINGVRLELESVVAIFFFMGGLQLLATGMMCEYISRLFVEVQRKPYYVIRDELE